MRAHTHIYSLVCDRHLQYEVDIGPEADRQEAKLSLG